MWSLWFYIWSRRCVILTQIKWPEMARPNVFVGKGLKNVCKLIRSETVIGEVQAPQVCKLWQGLAKSIRCLFVEYRDSRQHKGLKAIQFWRLLLNSLKQPWKWKELLISKQEGFPVLLGYVERVFEEKLLYRSKDSLIKKFSQLVHSLGPKWVVN